MTICAVYFSPFAGDGGSRGNFLEVGDIRSKQVGVKVCFGFS